MQKPNKIIRVLKDNSGASILFVMGVALLLLAISTSALVAASASTGAYIAKQNRNQLNLYSDGIQKAIMSSLMSGEKATLSSVETLNGQILREIYEHIESSLPATASSYATQFSIPFEFEDVTLSGDDNFECVVEVLTKPYVIFNTPSSIMVSSSIIVTARVTYRGTTLTSVVTYDYFGGLLEATNSSVKIAEAGEWRFVSHEKVDSQD